MTTDTNAPLPFARRHIGPSPAEVTAMLQTLGAASMDDFLAHTLPPDIRQRDPLDVGPALSESEALAARARGRRART